MSTLSLLYKDQYPINDKISVIIPTVGEVLDHEDQYYSAVHILTAQPIDFMVQLDDAGIDFTKINEWELFLLLWPSLAEQDMGLLLGGVDFGAMSVMMNEQNGQLVLVDKERDVRIDRAILGQIAATLRKIHHLERNRRKPANEEARTYMIERARQKMLRNRNRKTTSQLESLIVALVNTEQYKYDFESTQYLTIYQFNESVQQIIKKIDYDNRMHGVYAGTINPKELSQDDLNWLVHK